MISMKITHWGQIPVFIGNRKTVGWGDGRNPNKPRPIVLGSASSLQPASTPCRESPWQPQGHSETAYHQYQNPDDKAFPGAGQVTLFLVMGNRAAVGALGHIIRDFFPAIQAIDRTHSVTGTARTGELVVYIVLA